MKEAGRVATTKVVQDLLGHSTITLTLDTYSHLTQPLHEEAARTMDALLGIDLEKR
jgi:integrase